MNRYPFLALLLLLYGAHTNAQTQLHLQSGITATSFFYKNSQGQSDKNLRYLLGNYSTIGCDANFRGHVIRPALGFRQAGATEVISRTKIKWDLKYIDLHFGYGYNYYNGKRVMLGIGAGLNLGVLLQGEQSIGNETYNLLKEKALREIDLGANGFANAKIKMAEGVYLSLEYRYNVSMLNIETDSKAPAQTTRNQSHNFLAGIAINLNGPAKAKKPASPVFDSLAINATNSNTTPSDQTITNSPADTTSPKTEAPHTTPAVPAKEPENIATIAQPQAAKEETKPNPDKAKLPPGSRLVVIGAVIKETEAEAMAQNLKAKGYPAGYLWIQDYEPNGRPMYRIYAGPYPSIAAAQNVQIQLKGLYPNSYNYQVK